MNFFKSINEMQLTGCLTIVIAKDKNEKLIASVHYKDTAVGDKAARLIPTLNLNGTAEELDAVFFDAIAQPLKDTAGLMTNMEQYLKQKEKAKLQSQQEKDKAVKTEKEKSDKQKKFANAMKIVDELEAKGKFRDAWIKVPDATLFPEQAEAIRKRKNDLAKKFAPDLFGEEPSLPEAAPTNAITSSSETGNEITHTNEDEDKNEDEDFEDSYDDADNENDFDQP